MTQTDSSRAEAGRLEVIGARRSPAAIRWWYAAAALILAIALQSIGHLNGDDSWFLTFAEKYVDGQAPYLDVSDPNPPAAFLVYVPGIHLARYLGARPEFAVALLTFAAALLALVIAGTVLRRAALLQDRELPAAAALALYVSLVVPAFCFAEREHIAFLALLPLAAVLAARCNARPVAPQFAWLAGVGAGLACTFKPYFLVPVAFAFLATGWPRVRCALRSSAELAAIGLVLAAYAISVALAFPDYLKVFWLALDVYAPVRDRIANLLTSPLFLANAALICAWAYVARDRRADLFGRICAALSLGFLATFLIQGKGWNNHAYPGIAFGMLSLAAELRAVAADASAHALVRRRGLAKYVFLPLFCAAPFLFGAARLVSDGEEHPGLTAAVARIAPAHPKIAALAEQLDFGHPLVRQLGGTWIGTQNCLWISWGVKYLRRHAGADPAVAARRNQYLEADLRMFADDLRSGKPDVLLVESADLEAWARIQPALSGIFDAYVQAGKVGDIELWRRADMTARTTGEAGLRLDFD